MNALPPGSNLILSKDSGNWLDADCPIVESRISRRYVGTTSEKLCSRLRSDSESSSSESNWEILGENLNVFVSNEHSRHLARVFPGVREFPHAASIYGGECALCFNLLSPDDATLDFFDGNFYCSNCHQGHEAAIPRDIIECWDFTLKPVSFATKKFLDSISSYPLINIALVNPSLFTCVPELGNLRKIRRTLSLLWALVTRCSKSATLDLLSTLKDRSYMLDKVDTIDKYSLQDLQNIQNGNLLGILQTTVDQFVLSHVTSCAGCRVWVSFCDICRDLSRPIWPYAITQFRRCITPGCRRAMHSECLDRSKNKATITEVSHTACPNIEIVECTDVPNPGRERSAKDSHLTMKGMELLPRCNSCKNNLSIFS